MGLPGKMASTHELQDEQVELQEVEAVGLFGIRPTWKDGHNTGIYSYATMERVYFSAADVATYGHLKGFDLHDRDAARPRAAARSDQGESRFGLLMMPARVAHSTNDISRAGLSK